MKEEDAGMKSMCDLLKSNELYRILIENNRDAVLITENSVVVDCNEAAVSMFGFTSMDELIGKLSFVPGPELQPEGSISKEKAGLFFSKSHQKRTQTFHWTYAKSDGSLFDAMISMSSFKHEGHSFVYFSITPIASAKDHLKIESDEFSKVQTEDPLMLSHSLLQATLDSTADGILAVDLGGQITSFNKQFKAIFNISDKTLESRQAATVMKSVLKTIKDPDQFIIKIQYLIDHPESEGFDRIELNGGRIIERYSCPQQFNGQPIGRVVSFRDITERIKTEEQLHLMAHAIKSINESISITDSEDRILFVNAAFVKTYGYSEAELLGKDIKMVRPPGIDPNFVTQRMNLTNSSTWQGEIMNRRKDGSDFLILFSASIVLNEMGETLGMVGISVDITQQKQAEIELKQSEERLRNLINTMPDGVYRSTPEGRFVEVNPAMVKMLGYDSREELMNIDIKTQLYFDLADRESLILEEKLKELGIFRLKKKDGSGIWVEDHGWYVTDENGETIFHEGISRDVTERKRAEIQLHQYSEQLKELNATKDKFFSIIAHDLKSPFNSIIGLSNIIKNEARVLDIETIEQYAEFIHSTSVQTFRLLENLLDWARLQQSQIIFRPVSVVLKEIVDEIFELMIERAQSKKIELIHTVSGQLVISADQDMLKTILRNLVSNALKFTSRDGKIEVKAVVRDNEIEIAVKDTGIGIRKEEMELLFKSGSVFSQKGTENETGTGIGLMLCKEFIEKHGGKIWVESEEGKGCTFIFTLNQKNKT